MLSILRNNPIVRATTEVICVYVLLETASANFQAKLDEGKRIVSAQVFRSAPTTNAVQLAESLRQGSSLFAELQQHRVLIDRTFIERTCAFIHQYRDQLKSALSAESGSSSSKTRGIWASWRKGQQEQGKGSGPSSDDIDEFFTALMGVPFNCTATSDKVRNSNMMSNPEQSNILREKLIAKEREQELVLRSWEHWWSTDLRDIITLAPLIEDAAGILDIRTEKDYTCVLLEQPHLSQAKFKEEYRALSAEEVRHIVEESYPSLKANHADHGVGKPLASASNVGLPAFDLSHLIAAAADRSYYQHRAHLIYAGHQAYVLNAVDKKLTELLPRAFRTDQEQEQLLNQITLTGLFFLASRTLFAPEASTSATTSSGSVKALAEASQGMGSALKGNSAAGTTVSAIGKESSQTISKALQSVSLSTDYSTSRWAQFKKAYLLAEQNLPKVRRNKPLFVLFSPLMLMGATALCVAPPSWGVPNLPFLPSHDTRMKIFKDWRDSTIDTYKAVFFGNLERPTLAQVWEQLRAEYKNTSPIASDNPKPSFMGFITANDITRIAKMEPLVSDPKSSVINTDWFNLDKAKKSIFDNNQYEEEEEPDEDVCSWWLPDRLWPGATSTDPFTLTRLKHQILTRPILENILYNGILLRSLLMIPNAPRITCLWLTSLLYMFHTADNPMQSIQTQWYPMLLEEFHATQFAKQLVSTFVYASSSFSLVGLLRPIGFDILANIGSMYYEACSRVDYLPQETELYQLLVNASAMCSMFVLEYLYPRPLATATDAVISSLALRSGDTQEQRERTKDHIHTKLQIHDKMLEASLTKTERHLLGQLQTFLSADKSIFQANHSHTANTNVTANAQVITSKNVVNINDIQQLNNALSTHLAAYCFWLYGVKPGASVASDMPASLPIEIPEETAVVPAYIAPLLPTTATNKSREEYITAVKESGARVRVEAIPSLLTYLNAVIQTIATSSINTNHSDMSAEMKDIQRGSWKALPVTTPPSTTSDSNILTKHIILAITKGQELALLTRMKYVRSPFSEPLEIMKQIPYPTFPMEQHLVSFVQTQTHIENIQTLLNDVSNASISGAVAPTGRRHPSEKVEPMTIPLTYLTFEEVEQELQVLLTPLLTSALMNLTEQERVSFIKAVTLMKETMNTNDTNMITAQSTTSFTTSGVPTLLHYLPLQWAIGLDTVNNERAAVGQEAILDLIQRYYDYMSKTQIQHATEYAYRNAFSFWNNLSGRNPTRLDLDIAMRKALRNEAVVMPQEQKQHLQELGLDIYSLQMLKRKYASVNPECRRLLASWHKYFDDKNLHKKKVLDAFMKPFKLPEISVPKPK